VGFICRPADLPLVKAPPGVEDPISAIFDLSDRVAGMAPTVRRMYRYTATVVVLWILLMIVVILVTFGSNFVIAVLGVAGLVVGVLGLGLLRETDRFFTAFVQRHRVIVEVRDAEPVPRVPEGRSPVERLSRYLAASNAVIDRRLREDPGSLRYRVELPAGSRRVPFDLVLLRPGSTGYRLLGRGDPGFAVLARLEAGPTSLGMLQQLEADVQAVAARLPGAPARVILLRTSPDPLPQEVYDFALGHPVEFSRGLGRYRAAIEIITEHADGTYDLVPHVLGVP
jgi:hypothetical protein